MAKRRGREADLAAGDPPLLVEAKKIREQLGSLADRLQKLEVQVTPNAAIARRLERAERDLSSLVDQVGDTMEAVTRLMTAHVQALRESGEPEQASELQGDIERILD